MREVWKPFSLRDLLKPKHCVRPSGQGVAGNLLVNELASARGGRYVASMNGVMAVGAPVHQGQACTVVVSRVTLQTKRRLAQRQQILVRRTMRRMTLQAILSNGRMLEREWPLKLSVAA